MAEPLRQTIHSSVVTPSVFPAAVSSAIFARRGPAWSELTVLEDGRARIRLGGLFRTTWMAALCRGLAERHLSIEQAHAQMGHDGSWNVEILVVMLAGAAEPASLPLIALAEAEVVADPGRPKLQRFALDRSADHGGTLLLALEADDALGLLGQLLLSLAQLGLFPVEMHVETRAGRAADTLWLATTDRKAPSEASQHALASLLEACAKR